MTKKTIFTEVMGILLLLISLFVYTLPWVTSPSASLSFGAFDLAEWASLHPASRATSPILLTSLLLRMPLVCLAWIMAFNAPPVSFRSKIWWLYLVICVVLAIFSSPPVEFLTTNRDDVNYQQQAFLVLIALIGSGIGLSGLLPKYRMYIAFMSCLWGIACAMLGMVAVYDLLKEFGIPVQSGIGFTAMLVCFILFARYTYLSQRIKRRR